MTLHDHLFYVSMALSSLIALGIVAGTGLRGWRGWLDLKRAELDRVGGGMTDPGRLPSAERIEMADLKERIRKLEAIAAGVDL